MEEKNKYENSFKIYEIELETTKRVKGGELNIKKRARLDTDNNRNEFSMREILQFSNDLKSLCKTYRELCKKGGRCTIDLHVSVYKHIEPKEVWRYGHKFTETIENISFKRWTYSGYPEYDGCQDDDNKYYIYLSPDTRYVNECHDICLRIDHMIEDLAEAHLEYD